MTVDFLRLVHVTDLPSGLLQFLEARLHLRLGSFGGAQELLGADWALAQTRLQRLDSRIQGL